MFTVLFYSHGSCHPEFKIKATSSKHSWFSPPVTSGSNFHFDNLLQRKLELEAGTRGSSIETVGIRLPFWVVCTALAVYSSFLTLLQPVFTWNSSLLSPLCLTAGANRIETDAYVDFICL